PKIAVAEAHCAQRMPVFVHYVCNSWFGAGRSRSFAETINLTIDHNVVVACAIVPPLSCSFSEHCGIEILESVSGFEEIKTHGWVFMGEKVVRGGHKCWHRLHHWFEPVGLARVNLHLGARTIRKLGEQWRLKFLHLRDAAEQITCGFPTAVSFK